MTPFNSGLLAHFCPYNTGDGSRAEHDRRKLCKISQKYGLELPWNGIKLLETRHASNRFVLDFIWCHTLHDCVMWNIDCVSIISGKTVWCMRWCSSTTQPNTLFLTMLPSKHFQLSIGKYLKLCRSYEKAKLKKQEKTCWRKSPKGETPSKEEKTLKGEGEMKRRRKTGTYSHFYVASTRIYISSE